MFALFIAYLGLNYIAIKIIEASSYGFYFPSNRAPPYSYYPNSYTLSLPLGYPIEVKQRAPTYRAEWLRC